jgi:hypothetical protein
MKLLDRTDAYLRDGFDIGHAIAYAVQDMRQQDIDTYEYSTYDE